MVHTVAGASMRYILGTLSGFLRRRLRVQPAPPKPEPRIEITKIETIQAERPEDIQIERAPVDQMTRQQLKRMGLKEIERKLRAMYPGADRKLIRKYAQYQLSQAWAKRDKAAVRKAIKENDAKGVGIGMKPLEKLEPLKENPNPFIAHGEGIERHRSRI